VNSDIDVVAEAIWRADQPSWMNRPPHPWEKVSAQTRGDYRRMARAAIDALQLKEPITQGWNESSPVMPQVAQEHLKPPPLSGYSAKARDIESGYDPEGQIP